MLPPEEDLEARTPVWDSLQMLFMDTDPVAHYEDMVLRCAASPYTLDELEAILFNELLPALRGNLYDLAGEWRGFEVRGLVEHVLANHEFGKRRPRFGRWMVSGDWPKLSEMIAQQRATQSAIDRTST
ncbi:MAG: hypothetical protein AAF184_17880 [Pseudomonadota bacterium]